jgi:hypothetical protein
MFCSLIGSRFLPYEKMKFDSTIFGWQTSLGPLDTIDLSPVILRNDEQVVWLPNGLMSPGFWSPSVRPFAAVINFGAPLPPGAPR